MTRIAALFAAALPAVLGAFTPRVELSVSPTNIVVSEKAEATITVLLPKRATPSLSANFIPEGLRLQMERQQVRTDGGIAWRYVTRIPVAGDVAGVKRLGPVTAQIPVRTDFFGMVSQTAELKSGADLLLEYSHFEKHLTNANLIITGEGSIDRQSLMGKIPGKVLQIAQKHQVPVIAIAGIAKDMDLLKKAGFSEIYTTKPDSMPLDEAMKPGIAEQNIKRTILSIFQTSVSFD